MSKYIGKSAVIAKIDEFVKQSVGANCCLHYAAKEPIKRESESDTGFTEFLAKMIQNSVNEGTKHNE